MKTVKAALISVAVTAGSALVACTAANAYSAKLKDACSADYTSYCSQYKEGSTQLRRCFESNRHGLSRYCISALVAAGMVPSKYLKKY